MILSNETHKMLRLKTIAILNFYVHTVILLHLNTRSLDQN
jgi:hypothetical protein